MPKLTFGTADFLIAIFFLAIWLSACEMGSTAFPIPDFPLLIPWLTLLSWVCKINYWTASVTLSACAGSAILGFICFIDLIRFSAHAVRGANRHAFLLVCMLAAWLAGPLLLLGMATWYPVKKLFVIAKKQERNNGATTQ